MIGLMALAACSAADRSGGGSATQQGAANASDSAWRSYNRTLDGQRYSPLSLINTTNVGRLKPVCEFGVGEEGGFQTGPVIIGDTMFLTTAHTTVAMNAAACAPIWRKIDTRTPAIHFPSTAASPI
jgi:alcohol dehydrogenase (cytochrome c)